ncbi:MAG: single-stranded DNA-binding protein [Firmicutes bacterium]|nr:single-stranded DNA-binding protein [Bacillota bacterium]
MENASLANYTKDDNTQGMNNNRVMLSGSIVGEPKRSHTVFGEGFYELVLSVNRLSSMQDLIPITVPERLLISENLKEGMVVTVKGQFRSYNKIVDGRSKLMLTMFVREILHEASIDNPNEIELVGFICKPPIYRTTPFNREIADILLAVNRTYNKSDYIPAIAWGRNARFAEALKIGERVNLSGRVQSREYQKRLENGETETRVAYEISINKLSYEELPTQFDLGDTAFTAEDFDVSEVLA